MQRLRENYTYLRSWGVRLEPPEEGGDGRGRGWRESTLERLMRGRANSHKKWWNESPSSSLDKGVTGSNLYHSGVPAKTTEEKQLSLETERGLQLFSNLGGEWTTGKQRLTVARGRLEKIALICKMRRTQQDYGPLSSIRCHNHLLIS